MHIYEDIVGKTIGGRYYIKKWLGSGAFGYVFQAEHKIFDIFFRDVALKVTKQTHITTATAKEAFREAVISAKALSESKNLEWKKYILAIFDIGILSDLDGRGYIASELVKGGDLRKEISRYHAFPLGKTLNHIKEICRGMAVLHQFDEPIVHRDLKPENIFLTDERRVKIGDFGLAVQVDALLGDAPGGAGTLSYQAPESLIGSGTTPASDVYSMGLIFYEMLTGSNPFNEVGKEFSDQNKIWEAQIEARRTFEFRPPSSKNLELKNLVEKGDMGLDEIVLKCLCQGKDGRYQTAGKLLEDIEEWELTGRRKPPVTVSTAEAKESQVNELIEEGKFWLEKEEYHKAGDCFAGALEKDPSRTEIYFLLGNSYFGMKEYDRAIKSYLKIPDWEKKRDVCFKIAETYEKKGMSSKANVIRQRCR